MDPDTGDLADQILDPVTGELRDADAALTPATSCPTPPRRHGRPVTVNLTWDLTSFLGLTNHPGELLGPGVMIPPQAMRELIGDAELRRLIYHPLTGRMLDLTPFTIRPSAGLAGFVAMRDVTPTTPTAGPTGTATTAGAGDLDHVIPRTDSGQTVEANLASPTRRWHNMKTHAGWTVIVNPDRTWTWTSPAGRIYTVHPHDHRPGP